jgi:hypothetical protein
MAPLWPNTSLVGKITGGDMDVERVLDMIEKDMEKDAKDFDGKPFNGRTVAAYFGYQGAAISALARVIRTLHENKSH